MYSMVTKSEESGEAGGGQTGQWAGSKRLLKHDVSFSTSHLTIQLLLHIGIIYFSIIFPEYHFNGHTYASMLMLIADDSNSDLYL